MTDADLDRHGPIVPLDIEGEQPHFAALDKASGTRVTRRLIRVGDACAFSTPSAGSVSFNATYRNAWVFGRHQVVAVDLSP